MSRIRITDDLARALEVEAECAIARRSLLDFVRLTFPGYVAGWFHEEVASALEWFEREVRARRSPRLLLVAPPRHGKSEIVSRRFPVWFLGRNPTLYGTPTEIVVASYQADLAQDHSRDARELARSPIANLVFPGIIPERRKKRHATDYVRNNVDRVSRWAVSSGGSYTAVGVDGPLTGRGAHVLLIDDPVKDAAQAESATEREAIWKWWQTTAFSRVAPGGGVLLTLTRWHEDDLAGRILKADTGGRWRVLRFPAIAETEDDCRRPAWLTEALGKPRVYRKIGEALHGDRWPLERLEEAREGMVSYWFRSLYQGSPSSARGTIFLREWFSKRYDFDPMRATFDEILLSVDLPFRKRVEADTDFAVFAVWGVKGSKRFLLDVVRDRMSYTEARSAFRAIVAKWGRIGPKIIEARANGDALADDLEDEIEGIIRREPRNVADRKVLDARLASRFFEAGDVILPASAPWLSDWIEEHVGFTGRGDAHDDQVDTTSQILLYLSERDHEVDADEEVDAILGLLGRAA